MIAPRAVEVCTTSAQMQCLAPAWDGLDTFLQAPLGHYDWAAACADALAGDSRLFMPVVRHGGAPVAVAPLVRPRGYLATARQLGVGDHGEPGDFNYADLASLDRLALVLADQHVPLMLARVPSDSPVTEALRTAYRRRALVIVRPQPGCPFIAIAGSDDEVSAALPSRLRSDLRRAMRKAQKMGDVAFETHAPASSAELLPLWDQALRVEAAGWKGRSRSALAVDHRVGSFYTALATRATEAGTLRILFLRIGSDVAATMIALEDGGRLWILKIGYDERFAACSPGMLVMREGLRYAARAGLTSFEFLGTGTGWTRRWTDTEWATERVYVYPFTLQGMTLLAFGAVAALWNRPRRELEQG